ncbi:MAG: hypothetical protein U0790_22095 [Isosphaeraceae bacterium]
MRNRLLSLLALTAGLCLPAAANAGPTTISFNFLNDPAAPSPGGVAVLSSNVHTFYSDSPVNPLYHIDAIGSDYTGVIYPVFTGQLGVYSGATPTTNNGAVKLTIKNQGGDENGLGLVPDPNNDYELSPPRSIALDLTWLKSQVAIASVELKIGSSQANEGFHLFGSSSHYLDATTYASSPSELATEPGGPSGSQYTVLISAADIAKYNNLIVVPYGSGNSYSPNILINSLTVTTDGTDCVVPEPASIVSAAAPLFVGLAIWVRRRRRSTRA